jgi:hypothetical protein
VASTADSKQRLKIQLRDGETNEKEVYKEYGLWIIVEIANYSLGRSSS